MQTNYNWTGLAENVLGFLTLLNFEIQDSRCISQIDTLVIHFLNNNKIS